MASAMQELMDMKIWMLWRWSTDQNGKLTKKPFAAGGGPTGTDDNWSHTWVKYNDVVKAKERNSIAAGVGFKIPKGYWLPALKAAGLPKPARPRYCSYGFG